MINPTSKNALTNVLKAMNIYDEYIKCDNAFNHTCNIGDSVIELYALNDNIKVTSLTFQKITTHSYIHPDICLLTDLDTIIIGFCNVNGKIPDNIGNLSKLQTLYLFHGNLSGSIPKSMSNLTRLTGLSFDNNKLSGSVEVLNNLSKLTYLVISNNNFTGELPKNIFNNSFTKYTIYMNNNNFTGNIPIEIKNVSVNIILDNNCLKITKTVATAIKNNKNIGLNNNNISTKVGNEYGLRINSQRYSCNPQYTIYFNNRTGCHNMN
jgi:hypothetical protein